jgi:hypothetical protein
LIRVNGTETVNGTSPNVEGHENGGARSEQIVNENVNSTGTGNGTSPPDQGNENGKILFAF